MRLLKDFITCEDGAVTPELVLLTAALVSLSLAVTFKVRSGATDAADGVAVVLTEDVGGRFD